MHTNGIVGCCKGFQSAINTYQCEQEHIIVNMYNANRLQWKSFAVAMSC